MALALPVVMMQRKEVRNMKIATSFLAVLLFTGTLGALNNAIAEDGIIERSVRRNRLLSREVPGDRPAYVRR